MKTTRTIVTSTLAALLLASAAGAAMAQDQGRHRGDGGQRDGGGGQNAGGERPQYRGDGGQSRGDRDFGGRDRSNDQAPAAAPAPAAPQAPRAAAAVQAPEARPPQARFRGDGGRDLSNGRGREQGQAFQGGEQYRDRGDNNRRGDDRRPDANRGDDRRNDANRDGRRDNDRRWDGDRNGDRNDNRFDNRGDNRRGDDRRGNDRGGWDRRDDRGRPHWQQGRYPSAYRSPNRYRYSGYYRPQIGFYSHNWAFGEFLPRGWYGSDYLLDSWWSYDLPYPPPGFDWVRVGPDALLIDSYSGRVVQVVRDLFY